MADGGGRPDTSRDDPTPPDTKQHESAADEPLAALGTEAAEEVEKTMINVKNRAGAVNPEPTPTVAELRFAVDATEAPLAYPAVSYPDDVVEQLEVELAGPGLLATLVLPIGEARSWAGELFGAVSVAYREATGDPHALTDFELASLGDPNAYDPGPGVLVVGEDNDTPARVRFHIAVDIAGHCLSTPDLRAALVEHVAGRFNAAHVAVSAGEPLAGRLA
jgi:hypothetical protein